MLSIHEILKQHWGYDSFRPLQEDVINAVLKGSDTLALLPTGGGKSLCFQVPAMAMQGICLVISPLIALMKDQVENLQNRNIPAVAVVSGMSRNEVDIAFDNCIYGKLKFLYLSPERLASEIARERIKKMKVNLVAVDEAHCISQWGYDFRPPYLKIADIREFLPGVPVLALTATATRKVVNDIQEKLHFPGKNVLRKSFARKNLSYVVLHEEDKLGRLLRIVNNVKGTGIVYVRNRRKTGEIAQYLNKKGVSADDYHAGLETAVRSRKQDGWMKNRTRVIVATNAFGMGIDKPDVRFVVHLDLPESPEAYFQEAGRGGRDGKKAWAALLYNEADRLEFEHRINLSFPKEREIKNVYQALANHYRLVVGAGEGACFGFDIAEFSGKYSMKPTLVHNCLKFLEKEGYVAVTESVNLPSRIHIKAGKEHLYRFQVAHPHFETLIKLLLRSYSGVFDEYVKISETDLARRMGSSRMAVSGLLKRLDEFNILSYLPQNDMPQLTFLTERIDVKNLKISKINYTERKNAAFKRMEAVVHYASTANRCRSQLLLAYFGETGTEPCGICDVCLERKRTGLGSPEFEKVAGQVKELTSGSPLALDEVVNSVEHSTDERTLKVIRWLMDNEKVKYDKENKLHWME